MAELMVPSIPFGPAPSPAAERLLVIDPGRDRSAWLLLQWAPDMRLGLPLVEDGEITPNGGVVQLLANQWGGWFGRLVIEQVEGMGMAGGGR